LFVIRSLDATLRGMTGFPGLGGLAAVGMLVLLAKQLSARTWGTPLLPAALTATTLVMLAGVGLQRAGFGLEIAESSRYVYMSAVLLAPLFALLCDSIAERFAAPATAVVRALLAVAIVINIAWLHGRSSDWARVAESERLSLELLAGVPNLAERLAPDAEPLQVSKDVRVADIPMLVAEGAVVPRQPANPAEQQLLDRLLAPTTP
jgi:hypothetical protein